MAYFIYLWIGGIGLLIVVSWLKELKRIPELKAMAKRRGFSLLGSALSHSVPLQGTPFEFATSTWNVIEGVSNGIRFVAFDCRVGHGKGSWRRTVIAAKSSDDVFGSTKFNRDLTVDYSGGWVLLYQPKKLSFIPAGLMPALELEAHLDSIRA